MNQVQSTGNVVWVTGAGQGMGASHARRLAEREMLVACMDIDFEAAERTAGAIASAGGQARAIRCDVTNSDDVAAAASAVMETWGAVDVVIANAGVLGPVADVADISTADWNQTLAVNLTGVFHTARAAIPQMRTKGGSMVLVSSISGLRGYAGAAAYNASKHGVIGLMRTLANELARSGIRVNAICPGWVDTPMFDLQVEIARTTRADAEQTWSRDQLIERLITAEEVSDAVEWLVSPAAKMITGIALPIDGGMLERTLPNDVG